MAANDQITSLLGTGGGNADPGHAQALVNIATNGNLLNQNISKLIQQIGTTFPISTVNPVANGGTGDSSLTANGVLYGNGTSPVSATAQGGSNTVLIANAGAPIFSATPTVTSLTTTGALVEGSTLSVGTTASIPTSTTTPIVLGGTATNATLTLQSTSGIGSGDAIIVKGGNNGATELVRWNTTNGTRLAAGTTSLSPLTFQSGTNLTTAAVGATEFDATCFYATAIASTRQVWDTEQLITLTGAYTLTSQTAAQALFNAPSNGTVTLGGSTTYFFECAFSLTSLSGSSHSVGFALGGTATLTRQAWWSNCAQAALATASTAQITFNTAANTTLVTASTTTTFSGIIWGKIVVGTGGTLIPQVSQLTNAAAAVVGNDSYFRIWPVGSNTVQSVGNWS